MGIFQSYGGFGGAYGEGWLEVFMSVQFFVDRWDLSKEVEKRFRNVSWTVVKKTWPLHLIRDNQNRTHGILKPEFANSGKLISYLTLKCDPFSKYKRKIAYKVKLNCRWSFIISFYRLSYYLFAIWFIVRSWTCWLSWCLRSGNSQVKKQVWK